MLLNLARVALVAALEATWGHVPALLFHDYGGTVLVIGWLFVFWTVVQRWILIARAPDGMETLTS
jgi:small basic protein